ncbi:MAG: p21-activated protein kinase-interacting protein 1-like protein, partial [Pleopsidium flavum]
MTVACEMGKRKRKVEGKEQDFNGISKKLATTSNSTEKISTKILDANTVQIITGSYERVLHGITATITPATFEGPGASLAIIFEDAFLFNAHSSAIRCLAISPPSISSDPSQPPKVILASGSTDERINLYHISASPPSVQGKPSLKPTLTANNINENPKNRELGSLLHHSSSISALYFPTRAKLLSAAEDNTIAVVRTRDWTVLSNIKIPIPKALGRPSGDTAPPGGSPAGVNDFAVHPSMKLMVSVGKGEKCMRLWNLVTGKKAGVLNFGKEILQGVGEGRWGNGEGRKVEWDSKGKEFAIGFERGVVVFGMDSKPKCRILPSPLTKIHQVRYVTIAPEDKIFVDVLALSTEDGRIIFYSTTVGLDSVPDGKGSKVPIPKCRALGQLGGKIAGLPVRVKDFEFLHLPAREGSPG